MKDSKEQLTQRVWEQVNKFQFSLYVIVAICMYIIFSILNDSIKYSRTISEINDIRIANEILSSDTIGLSQNENEYYLLETTYYENRETGYSWFYRSEDTLIGVPRYHMVFASDINQFSYVNSFLWGENSVNAVKIFNEDIKDSEGQPIVWNSSKYKNIESIDILNLISHSDDLFVPEVHTPHINDFLFFGAFKRDLSNGKEIGFGAISYIIKKKITLSTEQNKKMLEDEEIVIDSVTYPAIITDVTTQNFYFHQETEENQFIGILGFGLGNQFGLIDYSNLSTTYSSDKYLFNRNKKRFVKNEEEKPTFSFKSNFPNLYTLFYIDYEKQRNPRIGEIDDLLKELTERNEKISIPLIGISFFKADAGKISSMLLSVTWIIMLIHFQRFKEINLETIPLMEVTLSKNRNHMLVRLIKILLPLTTNSTLTILILLNYQIDIMIITSFILLLISIWIFISTFKFSKEYGLEIKTCYNY